MIHDIAIVLLVVILGYLLPVLFSFEEKDKKNVRLLWFYHLLFGVIFYYYVLSLGGSDSTMYWDEAKNINFLQAWNLLVRGGSTQAAIAINYFPSNLLSLSYFTGNIIYCFVGFAGLLLFYKITLEYVRYNTRFFGIPLFPAVFFLPNLHFWSCNVGKDTLLFFAIGIFSYGILHIRKRVVLIVLSLLIAVLIRPHIALFLLVGFAMAYLYGNRLPVYQKIFLFILLAGGALVVLPKVLEITNMTELSVESYEGFATEKVEQLSRGRTGSRIDISSYPLPVKIFSFLFRPTLIDVNSAISLVAAIENVILFILFIKAVGSNIVETFKNAPIVIKGLVFVLILGTIGFSMSLGNLGIMIRMRNMFLPGLLIYLMWCFSYQQQKKILRISTVKNRQIGRS